MSISRDHSSPSIEKKDPTTKIKVLVVDDNDFNVTTFAARIKQAFKARGIENYEIQTAKDGKEALEKATSAKEPFHFILSDIMMPIMKGPQFVKNFRDFEAKQLQIGKPIFRPVILFCSDSTEKDIETEINAAGLKASDYDGKVPKKLTKDHLINHPAFSSLLTLMQEKREKSHSLTQVEILKQLQTGSKTELRKSASFSIDEISPVLKDLDIHKENVTELGIEAIQEEIAVKANIENKKTGFFEASSVFTDKEELDKLQGHIQSDPKSKTMSN